jgi:hypothetical protein
MDSINPSTANLVLLYAAVNGYPKIPPIELTFIILRPSFYILIRDNTGCVTLTIPNKLVSKCAFNSLIEISSIEPINPNLHCVQAPYYFLNSIGKPKSKSSNPIVSTNIWIEL